MTTKQNTFHDSMQVLYRAMYDSTLMTTSVARNVRVLSKWCFQATAYISELKLLKEKEQERKGPHSMSINTFNKLDTSELPTIYELNDSIKTLRYDLRHMGSMSDKIRPFVEYLTDYTVCRLKHLENLPKPDVSINPTASVA